MSGKSVETTFQIDLNDKALLREYGHMTVEAFIKTKLQSQVNTSLSSRNRSVNALVSCAVLCGVHAGCNFKGHFVRFGKRIFF